MLFYGSGKDIAEVRSASIFRVEGEGLVFLDNADNCFPFMLPYNQQTKVIT